MGLHRLRFRDGGRRSCCGLWRARRRLRRVQGSRSVKLRPVLSSFASNARSLALSSPFRKLASVTPPSQSQSSQTNSDSPSSILPPPSKVRLPRLHLLLKPLQRPPHLLPLLPRHLPHPLRRKLHNPLLPPLPSPRHSAYKPPAPASKPHTTSVARSNTFSTAFLCARSWTRVNARNPAAPPPLYPSHIRHSRAGARCTCAEKPGSSSGC